MLELLKSDTMSIYLDEALESERRKFRFDPDSRRIDSIPDKNDILIRATEIVSGEYTPSLPEKVLISKLGTPKKRVIYVYNDLDRIALKLVQHVLSLRYDRFMPCCLAFRPGFSIQAAFRNVLRRYAPEYSCVRTDISDFFNSIDVDRMATLIRSLLSEDEPLSSVVERMLLDPNVIAEGHVLREQKKGVMAGMPLAPFLANLFLDGFDRQAVQWAPIYLRYSDDLIFFCRPEDAKSLLDMVRSELGALGLEINEDKTHISSPGESWSFLGLSYENGQVDLSEGAIEKMKGKISRAARKLYRWRVSKNASTERAARALIRKFQFKFYGTGKKDDELTWCKWYFPLLTCHYGLSQIDLYMQQWIRYLSSGRHCKKNFRQVTYDKMKEWGYIPLKSAYYNRFRVSPGAEEKQTR